MQQKTISSELETIEFVKRAAKCFFEDEKIATYSDDTLSSGNLFAVRWGLGEDCVLVFRLSEDFEPVIFAQAVRLFDE